MDASAKLRHCIELADLGREMHRHSLRRRHPDWSEGEVLAAFHRWLAGQPPEATASDRVS